MERYDMTLKTQTWVAAGLLVVGIVITIVFAGALSPPRHNPIAWGSGIVIANIGSIVLLGWIIGFLCRTNDGQAINWIAFCIAVIVLIFIHEVIWTKANTFRSIDQYLTSIIYQLLIYPGGLLLWAIPFQRRAMNRVNS